MYILKLLCALAVAFLCANGAKLSGVMAAVVGSAIRGYGRYVKPNPATVGRFTFQLATPYPIRDLERVRFKVTCPSKCKIEYIRLDKLKGNLFLGAESDEDVICDTDGQPCKAKNIDEKVFTITLTPNPSFSSGFLTVKLGQKGAKITEINVAGAMRLSKNLIRIKSGYKKPSQVPKRYKIQCNGPCNNLKVTADEDILVAVSREPVFATDDGCFNCFCVWKKNQNNPNCNSSGNLRSSTIYVHLIHYRNFTDAKAYVRGNLKSVELYDKSDRSNAYPKYQAVVGVVIGPTDNNQVSNLVVYCNTRCTDIKIEIITYSKSLVKTVRAGKDTSLNSNGQCKNCDCTSRQSCLKRFDPSLAGSGSNLHFEIDIKLGKSDRKRPAYVRVSGKGLREIKNFDSDYYDYYYYVDYYYY